MKNQQHDNLKQEQKRAIDALTKLQTSEYTMKQEPNEPEDPSAQITLDEIMHEIERCIEEMRQDPEKMEAMVRQFLQENEEPTHWRYKNKVYCEKCFIKLMMNKKGDNFTVTGLKKGKGAKCDVCGA